MTKSEFKRRWESNDPSEEIDWGDVADCYIEWGLGDSPRAEDLVKVLHAVLRAAGVME